MKEWETDTFTEKQYDKFILEGVPMLYGFRFAVNYHYFKCMIDEDYTLTDLILN